MCPLPVVAPLLATLERKAIKTDSEVICTVCILDIIGGMPSESIIDDCWLKCVDWRSCSASVLHIYYLCTIYIYSADDPNAACRTAYKLMRSYHTKQAGESSSLFDIV